MKKIVCLLAVFVLCLSVAAQDARAGEKTYNWRLASVWAEGFPLLESERTFAQRVEELSNGRLKIKIFPEGQIGPANQVLDLVSSGAVEMGGDWPNYWSGKNIVFDLLGSHVMGFNPVDYYNWIYAAGGLDFYEEFYGKFNCVYFPHHAHDIESGIRSSKPINTLADLQGLKIRMAGLVQGKFIQPFGAQPVSIALNEVYEAMQRGVVDACEISIPVVDESTKIYEVAKYWLTPGFHQTSSIHGIMINKDKWNGLPDDLKAIVRDAARANHLQCLAETTMQSAVATNTMLEAGVQTTRLTPEELAEVEKAKNAVMEDLAKQNPDYARVLKHQIEFVKAYAQYREASSPWSSGRTWETYPALP
ncbi:MAG: TRAP transporter substrate-binding protein DctP [Planctomycetaceae bacterium]|nr:TRAP transporter substrate-binding protein DctP [Planctomycetaceae bacterium]